MTLEPCVTLGDQEVHLSEFYLVSTLQKNGGIDKDVNHRVYVGWLKWRNASGLLCDRA